MSTAPLSRQRKPQRVLVAGEPVFIHRRKDGAQGWCGPGVYVLSEDAKPVTKRDGVGAHAELLAQVQSHTVRPATNEEAEGIEIVSSLLPNLTEAVREGRTRHFADITEDCDPEDDEPMVVEGDVMDVRLGRPDSQSEQELNAPASSNAPSHSDRSEAHAEPEAEVSTSAGTDMEIGVNDRRVRFREERDPPRHHLDVSSDRELIEEPRKKIPREAETSESVVPFHSSEASSSEIQQTSTAAASDNPTGERLYPSMTEEGPTGDYKMTMQRDRHGRWMPTKGERTMNIQKARGERRNFYVAGSQEHGTFSIASVEASTLHGEFYLTRRNADEVSWNHLSSEEQTQFSKAIETEWQGALDFNAVTVIDSTQADVIREKHCERVISSRRVLRWKETDTGHKAKARWCVDGFKDPDIHEIERLLPKRQNCRPSTLHCRSWRRLRQKGRWPTERGHSCKAIRVFEVNHCRAAWRT